MRIGGWHIEGFGIFQDFEVRLSDGLTVILGPNEAGKSTLLGFLRTMLFGFPSRRNRTPQYPPLRGGRHGGRLVLCEPDKEIVIERFASRKNGLRVNGREGAEQELQALLGGADENVFCSVFAFSLSEMQSFEWLRADQIRERIFSAGIAGAGASARKVMDTLEDEASAILRARGASRVRDLNEQTDQAERKLKAAQAEADRYLSLELDCEKWSAQAAALSAEEAELRRRQREIEALLEPRWRNEKAREELAALAVIDEFPSAPESRLSTLAGSVEVARTLVCRLEQEQSAKEQQRAQFAMDDRLGELSDRVEQFYATQALHSERLKQLAALRERKSRVALWMALGACIALASGWLTGRGELAAGMVALLGGLAGAGFVVYQRAVQTKRAARLQEEVERWEQPVQEMTESLRRGEALISEFLELRSSCQKYRAIRAKVDGIDEALAGTRVQLDSARKELADAEQALLALLREAGATDQADFHTRLRTFRKRKELAAAIQNFDSQTSAGPAADELAVLLEKLATVQKQRDIAVGEQRLADAERRRIAESAAVPALQAELEWLRTELASAVRAWRVATLAKELVARTLQDFTRTRQPAVLEQASVAFARITDGVYARILQAEDGESLALLDRHAQRKRPEELSRGTAEQLYLCLRLGLASEFARRSAALPLIMDDVLVNFDPERARAVARELAQFAEKHQILIFTCHPETARLFAEVAPQAKFITMERYAALAAKQ